jgi:hypothetical protein
MRYMSTSHVHTSRFCRIIEFALLIPKLVGLPPGYEKDTEISTELDETLSASLANAWSPITVSCTNSIEIHTHISWFNHLMCNMSFYRTVYNLFPLKVTPHHITLFGRYGHHGCLILLFDGNCYASFHSSTQMGPHTKRLEIQKIG